MAHSAQKTQSGIADSAVDPVDAAQGGITEVLRNRNFLFLWLAQVLSQLAQQIINFVLLVQVATLTGSTTANAGIVICFTLPAILFSAIAGVVVDRHSKRKVLIATNVVRAPIVLLYVLTVLQPSWAGDYILPILYLNTLVFSSVSQFFVPAEGAMIPLLVKRNQLLAANSLFNLTFTVAQLVGFAFLGSLLTLLLPLQWIYVGLFGVYVICAGLCWLLPEVETPREHNVGTGFSERVGFVWHDFLEGWNFIRRDNKLVTAITYWSVAITVFMMLGVLGPKFVSEVLGVSPERLSFLLVPGGIGLVVGVILVGRVATEQNRTRMLNLALLGAGILLGALALVHDTIQTVASWLNQPPPPTQVSQIIMGVIVFFLGVLNSFITVPAQTMLQERAPEHIRARVFGAFYTVSNVLLILPLILAGALGDLLGMVLTVLIISLVMIAIALIGMRALHADGDKGGTPTRESYDIAGEALLPGNVPVPVDDGIEQSSESPELTVPAPAKRKQP